MVDVHVRRLAQGDEEILRALRLEALSDAPEAFGSTYTGEVSRTTADWQRWLARSATFVADDRSGRAVGLAVGRSDPNDPAVAYLMSMWVHPSFRGTGAADALVGEVIAWAQSEGAEVVRLNVVKANEAARRLYQRHGFELTGHGAIRERDSVAEVEMQGPARSPLGES